MRIAYSFLSGTVGAASLIMSLVLSGVTYANEGYYRSPTFHNNTLVFSSEGDLWRAPLTGGNAFRITSHPEVESSPKLSPDGRWIAFEANYDGAVEAYVMPLAGGSPKQVSFDSGRVWVRGWSTDGRILYTSQNKSGPTPRVLRLVDPATLAMEEIPLSEATNGTFANENTLYFSRYGMEMNRDNAKLYRGGGMAQLWRFDTASEREATRLAEDFGAPIRQPMWSDGQLYFISDKNGSGNIWSMADNGENVVQLTNHQGWDVREAFLKNGKIVYRLGADIRLYDLTTNSDTQINLSLTTDQDMSRVRWIEKPLEYLDTARLGGGENRLALTARGRIALASTGPLRLVDFQLPAGSRARNAVVGVKSDWVYAIIDRGNFGEIWRYPLNGLGKAEQLTNDADARKWQFYLAPNGTKLVYSDGRERLWLLDIESGEDTLIEEATDGLGNDVFGGVTFSKDSSLIAYHRNDQRGTISIYLYETDSGRREKVTDTKYDSYSAAFSADSKWLYFLSSRNFRATPGSPWGDRNMGTQFDKRGKVYALALVPDVRFPFQPADELEADSKEETPEEKETDDEKEANNTRNIEITWDGLSSRLFEVPVPAGNYSNLAANKDFLYLMDRGDSGPASIKTIKITNQKPKAEIFSAGIRSFELSSNGEQLFFSKGARDSGNLYIVKAGAKAPKDLADAKIRTKSWKIAIDPNEEWPQIFADAWRMHRDYSFDPNMRGLDWTAVRAKYEPLVSRIGHRAELHDLIGQMTSELGILHSQIGGGDLPSDTEAGTDSALGAEFETSRDGLRISHIYRTEEGLPSLKAPLAKPGVDAAVGDILVSINGRAISSQPELQLALRERADEQVLLELKRGENQAHHTIVRPVSMRTNTMLRYRDWVETNAEKVRQADGDKIGYLHIRAMGGNDIAAFARDFYEHWDKDGIIVDVRGNRGGNIDSWLIQTFLRKIWAFWHFNGRAVPYGNMQQTFRGHVVVLMNQSTYSDGETFAAGMKTLGLAPLIGTRTAGAGIWLSDRNRQSDGGIARIAESAQFGLDGRWLLEGRGVSPTIEIENPPFASYRGEDLQLETAIDYLVQKIQDEPIPPLEGQPLPPVGSYGRDIDD